MGRPLRTQAGGLVYHALNRANARAQIFAEPGDYAAFLRVLAEAEAEHPTRLLAYCLMPNHWHLVVWPERDRELSGFLGYDHNNQIVWAEKRATDGGTLLMRADYKYDVWGNRIEKAVDADGAGPGGTVTTRFAYDGDEVWADMNGSNQLQTRYLRGDVVDELFARISSV